MNSLFEKLTHRIEGIEAWIRENGNGCKIKQGHLVDGVERVYWHYGYMMALKDVLRLVRKKTGDLN